MLRKTKSFSTRKFVLNRVPSARPEDDWTFEDAVDSGVVALAARTPTAKDLRASWWRIDDELPMSGKLSMLSRATFYAKAAPFRISSYHNLGTNLAQWRSWIANQGPILTRLGVDRTWDRATATDGHLARYLPNTVLGGHAVCLVGYTRQYFIAHNSWGTGWGHGGFAYASNAYAQAAFTEAYGAVL